MVRYFSQDENFMAITYEDWYLELYYYFEILKEHTTGGMDQSTKILNHWHVLFLEWFYENFVLDYL